MSFALSRFLAPARSCRPSAALSYPLASRLTLNSRLSHSNAPSVNDLQSKLASIKGGASGNRFKEFDMQDRVYAITGGARGIGLSMAEALLEAGAKGIHFPSFLVKSQSTKQKLI